MPATLSSKNSENGSAKNSVLLNPDKPKILVIGLSQLIKQLPGTDIYLHTW